MKRNRKDLKQQTIGKEFQKGKNCDNDDAFLKTINNLNNYSAQT